MKQRTFYLLVFSVLLLSILGLCGLLVGIDFPLHDSHYAFPVNDLFWITAVTLLTCWLLYLITLPLLKSKVLTWIHILLTLTCLIFIYSYPYLPGDSGYGLAGMPRRYFDYTGFTFFAFFNYFAPSIKIAFIVLALGQILYFVNLWLGLLKRSTARN